MWARQRSQSPRSFRRLRGVRTTFSTSGGSPVEATTLHVILNAVKDHKCVGSPAIAKSKILPPLARRQDDIEARRQDDSEARRQGDLFRGR